MTKKMTTDERVVFYEKTRPQFNCNHVTAIPVGVDGFKATIKDIDWLTVQLVFPDAGLLATHSTRLDSKRWVDSADFITNSADLVRKVFGADIECGYSRGDDDGGKHSLYLIIDENISVEARLFWQNLGVIMGYFDALAEAGSESTVELIDDIQTRIDEDDDLKAIITSWVEGLNNLFPIDFTQESFVEAIKGLTKIQWESAKRPAL